MKRKKLASDKAAAEQELLPKEPPAAEEKAEENIPVDAEETGTQASVESSKAPAAEDGAAKAETQEPADETEEVAADKAAAEQGSASEEAVADEAQPSENLPVDDAEAKVETGADDPEMSNPNIDALINAAAEELEDADIEVQDEKKNDEKPEGNEPGGGSEQQEQVQASAAAVSAEPGDESADAGAVKEQEQPGVTQKESDEKEGEEYNISVDLGSGNEAADKGQETWGGVPVPPDEASEQAAEGTPEQAPEEKAEAASGETSVQETPAPDTLSVDVEDLLLDGREDLEDLTPETVERIVDSMSNLVRILNHTRDLREKFLQEVEEQKGKDYAARQKTLQDSMKRYIYGKWGLCVLLGLLWGFFSALPGTLIFAFLAAFTALNAVSHLLVYKNKYLPYFQYTAIILDLGLAALLIPFAKTGSALFIVYPAVLLLVSFCYSIKETIFASVLTFVFYFLYILGGTAPINASDIISKVFFIFGASVWGVCIKYVWAQAQKIMLSKYEVKRQPDQLYEEISSKKELREEKVTPEQYNGLIDELKELKKVNADLINENRKLLDLISPVQIQESTEPEIPASEAADQELAAETAVEPDTESSVPQSGDQEEATA